MRYTLTADVNPQGFDMRNAMDSLDVTWPTKADTGLRGLAANTWGLMIVEDRRAQMKRNKYVPDVGYAEQARRRIASALAANDNDPRDVY